MEKLTCTQVKQIDLVKYLSLLGHKPNKITGQDYWYLSPLREEKTPSFKVNAERNIWYDHGLGKGGDLINFGTLYFNCSIKEFLAGLITAKTSQNFSFHQPFNPRPSAGEKKEKEDARIVIEQVRPLRAKLLLDYLEKRKISLPVAENLCQEVDFFLYGKKNTAIGFANNAGGFELRSANFKGSSSPKATTFVNHGSKELNVFEGFFDYLSYLTAFAMSDHTSNNLILNSTAFFERSRDLMEQFTSVNLYLDRDNAGLFCTAQALVWNEDKYKDQSLFYKEHQDLNDWLLKQPENMKLTSKLRNTL